MRVGSVVLPALVSAERNEIGGIASYVIELEKRLKARGVHVVVAGYGPAPEEDGGFLSVLPASRAKARYLTYALWRRRGAWEFPPDTVVHVQRPDQALGFLGGPWPLVVSIHGCHRGVLAMRKGRMAARIYQQVVNRALRRADAVLFETQADLDAMVKPAGPLAGKSHLVPLGIDRDHFEPGDRVEARRKLGLPQAQRAVGYLGRLETEKNVLALVRAVEKYPDLELWIAGKGSMEEELRRVAGPRVRFLGFLPGPDVPVFIRAVDALALASPREGLATVVLQAWATGRPVVVPPVGDFPALVGKDGGIVAEDNSPQSLSTAIGELYRRLIPDASAADDLVGKLRGKSAPYDWEAVVEGVCGVYDAALAGRKPR